MTRKWTYLAVAAALVGLSALSVSALSSPRSSAGTTTAPVCAASELSVATGVGQAAAGNLGFPVIITNHGSTSCALDGFATVTAHTVATSPRPVTFVHVSHSQIYATAAARRVVIAPHGTASFGVSYVDALDQQYKEGPRCMMSSITVRLPGVAPLSQPTLTFGTRAGTTNGDINSCFAGFTFGLTPIVEGSAPPQG